MYNFIQWYNKRGKSLLNNIGIEKFEKFYKLEDKKHTQEYNNITKRFKNLQLPLIEQYQEKLNKFRSEYKDREKCLKMMTLEQEKLDNILQIPNRKCNKDHISINKLYNDKYRMFYTELIKDTKNIVNVYNGE